MTARAASLTDSPRSRGWTPGQAPELGRGRGFPALAGMDRRDPADRGARRRIPRARGDGPSAGFLFQAGHWDSPRSRGWTLHAGRIGPREGGFPALAGMDPALAGAPADRDGIPRARGDGPWAHGVVIAARADSPRSRGWTREPLESARRGDGFPALAGMDPRISPASARTARIPRARGDGPRPATRTAPPPADSPRSRGWTAALNALLSACRGFPALAGMDPRPRSRGHTPARIPRARGDGPRYDASDPAVE